ncbi:hypothetical protein MEX01_54380 [Methylorubrum extorquens]|uniref:hypothetical protein n=1 Tax=Methylorubrum extorquens TaxID=408 RepID=UPI0011711396|nr:hypothetical protein [Methylorubrum extorquens]GEL44847.1 hypothetical protein MEX01_54380 [Methylorubrum extorquens]
MSVYSWNRLVEPSRLALRCRRSPDPEDESMQPQVDVSSRSEVAMPSLLMAFLGFAASTVGVVGMMTLLGTLA